MHEVSHANSFLRKYCSYSGSNVPQERVLPSLYHLPYGFPKHTNGVTSRFWEFDSQCVGRGQPFSQTKFQMK